MTYNLLISEQEGAARFRIDDETYCLFDSGDAPIYNLLKGSPIVQTFSVPLLNRIKRGEVFKGWTQEHKQLLVEYVLNVSCTNTECLTTTIRYVMNSKVPVHTTELPVTKIHHLIHGCYEAGAIINIFNHRVNEYTIPYLNFIIQYQNCVEFAQATNSLGTLPQIQQLLHQQGTLNNLPQTYPDAFEILDMLDILEAGTGAPLFNCNQTPLIVIHALLTNDELSSMDLSYFKPISLTTTPTYSGETGKH